MFDLDIAHCPNCGGELKIYAAILEAPVVEKILTHLGMQARAPPRAAARGHALQAAFGCPNVTCRATQHPRPLGSAAPEGVSDRWNRPREKRHPANCPQGTPLSAALSTLPRTWAPSLIDSSAVGAVFCHGRGAMRKKEAV